MTIFVIFEQEFDLPIVLFDGEMYEKYNFNILNAKNKWNIVMYLKFTNEKKKSKEHKSPIHLIDL
jgi:hypothetical protein